MVTTTIIIIVVIIIFISVLLIIDIHLSLAMGTGLIGRLSIVFLASLIIKLERIMKWLQGLRWSGGNVKLLLNAMHPH